ncbi:hypothetical protein C0992_011152 [Termitomyces sp. T32_za158]|nr:hypothetical protein C0992_011152 [Termitomyces sp. T32_za158]
MLDMTPFVGHRSERFPSTVAPHHNIYELRGVLLHKGSSAHHGHYEALVFDKINKSWFQFNDEIVTKIKTLIEPSPHTTIVVDDDYDQKLQHQRTYASKRRRIESEDKSSIALDEEGPLEYITSRDAYMLIYARDSVEMRESLREVEINPDILTPPTDAMDVINSLNAAHIEACEVYNGRNELMKARFKERRRRVMNIYQNWTAKPANTDVVLVSRQALSAWLSQLQSDFASVIASDEKDQRKGVMLDDIMCVHGAVDPGKAGSIKRLSRVITFPLETGKTTTHGIAEHLYQIEHPRLVARFDRILKGASDNIGFWISKSWVKDWRLIKPKMHVAYQGDPAPDSDNFAADVLCEHGGLSPNTTSRRTISAEAAEFLQNLYPSWNPFPTNSEPCPVCDANLHISKGDKRELRKQAEDEKVRIVLALAVE